MTSHLVNSGILCIFRSFSFALDVLSSEPGLEGRAVWSGTEAVGLLDCYIKCLIVSPLIHSVCLKEDVSWAVEQWAEGGWIEGKEGSLSKSPAPSPFTSTITTNGGREAGV